MQHLNIKHIVLTLGLLIPALWCGALEKHSIDSNNITIKEGTVQGTPRTNSIQASIDGHYLTVVFSENLGQVSIVIESTLYGEVSTESTPTPNGVIIYISNTGSYTVTFTLPNGDVYYGDFEVTND